VAGSSLAGRSLAGRVAREAEAEILGIPMSREINRQIEKKIVLKGNLKVFSKGELIRNIGVQSDQVSIVNKVQSDSNKVEKSGEC
jgi:hypothetical protein